MLETYQNIVIKLNDEINSYNEKPTKACSARIRKLSNELSKRGPNLRRHMIELDKGK